MPRLLASLLLFVVASLFVSPAALAELQLELPPAEQPSDWEPVLQSVGLVAGSASRPPWARLVSEGDAGCHLEVATSWGASLREPVPCPASSSEREEVAALAVLMLEPMVRGERSVASLPGLAAGPRADEAPAGKRKLGDATQPTQPEVSLSDTVSAAQVRAMPRLELMDAQAGDMEHGVAVAASDERPAAAFSTPAGTQVGGRLDIPHPAAQRAPSNGTTQFNPLCYYTDCAVSFDRRSCGEVDGCSTADKCPDTYWLDFDRDGFGDPQTCLSLATERGVGTPVQNVGDCDDRHSSVHPNAEEVIGDGIDNNCDGVAR